MDSYTPDKIIDTLVQVTAHTERELLEAGLAGTLYEMLAVNTVTLSHIVYNQDQPERQLRLEITPAGVKAGNRLHDAETTPLSGLAGFSECHESRAPVERPLPGGTVQHLHPIINGKGQVASILELRGPPLSETDQRMLSGMVKIYCNYLRILDESEYDTLTGLLNRRTFDRNLDHLLAKEDQDAEAETLQISERRAGPNSSQNWLAVIDIDHFKKINDRYGHLYGDEVLLLLARLMRKNFRTYDKLFRFGGEEFVVVIKFTDQMGARAALERFRHAVESYNFPQVGTVTISMGFTEITAHSAQADILGRADEALYYAKRNGRNQVCSYEKLATAGLIKAQEIASDIELF